MIVVGTVVTKDCLVLFLEGEKKRKTVKRKAIESGKSIRPQMRPLKALKERKEAIGEKLFGQEFMHVPLNK